jgi:outer membrane protein
MSMGFGWRAAAACFALVCLSKAGLGQVKVGVFSLQRSVLETAELKKAQAEMEVKYRPRQQEMEKLQHDLQGIQQQLQNNLGKLSSAAEADLTAQGQQKQRELQRMNEDLQADFNADRNEILLASTKKMTDVVKKLAEEKGLDVVVDTQSTIYFKAALDLTNDAVVAYDKAYPAK